MRNIFNRKIVIFIVVLILSVIAQFFSVSLIFGLSISFAPIIYFSCIRIFGSRFSLLLVVMMSIVTYYLHFNNLSVFLSIAEVLVIGWFYSKKAKDLFTWSFVYSLIIFALYLIIITLLVDYISIPQTVTNFLLLQTVTATLFSALVADIFYDYAPFIPKLKYFFKASRRVYFGQVIAHLLIFFAVFPILIVILVTSQGMEQNMMQEYQNDYLRLESRLQTKITEMDSTEIQNHELDSLLEKAKIKSMLQDYIGLTDKRIYMLDQKNQVWLDMHSENTNIPDLNEIKQGYVKKIHSDGFIWLSTNSNHLFDWYRAYYIAETSFLNKQTFLVIPTFYLVNEVIENLLDYLIFVLFVLFVSLVFGMIVNHVLSKSLIRLTQLTSDLPEKMERQETFYWDDTNINEFSTLGDNIKKVANQLQSMFLEAKKKNDLLTARTNKLIESESKLYHLAHYDTLTDLPNRYSFQIDLKEMLESSQAEGKFAIIFIDLDRFKQVNDTLGHSGGDLLLKVFSKRLIDFEHGQPIAFYRLAGDEFVAIVELTTEDEVHNLCKQILSIINQPIIISNEKVMLEASIGISFYPDNGDTVDELLHHADTLMYQQKEIHHQQLDS